jgi:hypothetical protein
VGALVVACGVEAVRPDWVSLPARPGKAELDPLLEPDLSRIVIVGDDAALGAVVLRLLRRSRLDLAVGFVPMGSSVVAGLWGLPAAGRVELAMEGAVRELPLVRDDSGGVLMGLGTIGPVDGEAYCDDQLALRGKAPRVEVSPDPEGGGVAGRVVRRGFPRARVAVYRGRAFQVGCHPTSVSVDGVAHPRPVTGWTWYRHTEQLRAISR